MVHESESSGQPGTEEKRELSPPTEFEQREAELWDKGPESTAKRGDYDAHVESASWGQSRD